MLKRMCDFLATIIVAGIAYSGCLLPAAAQSPVSVIGPIIAGNCVQFNSNTIIKDAGFTCNGSGILPNASVAGTVLYFNGTNWVIFAGNTSGTNCLGENAVGAPQWTMCSGGSGANPGGSSTQIQYNAAGTFGGLSTFTTNGTNVALTAATLTVTDSGNGIIINTPSTSQQGCIPFQSAGTSKWTLCKNTADSISIVDAVSGNTVFNIASNGNMALMQTAGAATIGNTFFADNSGHPYCDVRAFGAGGGTPSVDQTAIANALSACSGGVVFFPCGNYGNTATWTVPANTRIMGASRACVAITSTQTNNDIFLCATGSNGPQPTEFSELQIYGVGALTTGSVPTAGYAINCGVGGNQQTMFNLEINGTFNGINLGGTNGRLYDSRIESIYGSFSINELAGGNTIEGNQLDNNSVFNATGGAGFGNESVYVTGSPTLYNTGAIVSSGSYLYTATVGGTSAPQAGGLSVVPMYKNITDGSITWQLIGSTILTLVNPGTESWIIDNDMTSPAQIAINLSGSNSATRNWIRGNDIAGEILAGVRLTNGATHAHIDSNQFFFTGYNQSGVTTGYPIYDTSSGGDNAYTIITGNTFTNVVDAAILINSSDYWIISANNIQHNGTNHQFCAIALIGSSNSPAGTTVTGNIVFNVSPGWFCMQGGGSNTVVVGNAAFGGTSSFVGTSTSPGNL
jgi:hypothetical protein